MIQADFPDVEESELSEAEKIRQQIEEQYAQTQKQLQEISLLLEQSELEVEKLTQRNTNASGTLERVRTQFERIPREEIRQAYDSSLDAQQRLFVVKGQVDKLKSDKIHLKKQVEILEMLESFMAEQPEVIQKPKSTSTRDEQLGMLIQAQEAERLRLSRQMHDGPAQALSNLILETEIAMRLFEVDREKAYQELGTLSDSATKTFQQVRDFIFELRPMMLDDLGLVPTLKKYTSAVQEQYGSSIRFGVTGPERRMEPYLEVMIFRAVQELVRNAITHSQSNQIEVQVAVEESSIVVNVIDDGIGFDVSVIDEDTSVGLKVIRDRVEMAGGDFEIESVSGEGTRISFQIPDSLMGETESNLA